MGSYFSSLSLNPTRHEYRAVIDTDEEEQQNIICGIYTRYFSILFLTIFLIAGIITYGLLFDFQPSWNLRLSSSNPNNYNNHIQCSSSLIDGYHPPKSLYYIHPRVPVQPFYQWENNNGYCGEVTVIQTAMSLAGTWFSQYNARLLCGAKLDTLSPDGTLDLILPKHTPKDRPYPSDWTAGMSLNQSGPPQWCEIFGQPNYNAQMEFETPDGDKGILLFKYIFTHLVHV